MHYQSRIFSPLLSALFLFSLFSTSVASKESCSITDDSSKRIVSIGGSITEILYALGCGSNVVAVDSSSVYPEPALKEKSDIGYMRAISAEPILSLNPDLIIADSKTEPANALKQIENSGVKIIRVTNTSSLEGIFEKITAISNAVGIAEEGRRLSDSIRSELDQVSDEILNAPAERRVMFLLSIRSGSIIAAGADTSAHEMIRLTGATNVFENFSGYKPVTAEAIVLAKPDALILADHALDNTTSPESILQRPEFIHTPAAGNNQVIVMDTLFLLGFGPRTPAALRELHQALK